MKADEQANPKNQTQKNCESQRKEMSVVIHNS
jgi:hypothetical protein